MFDDPRDAHWWDDIEFTDSDTVEIGITFSERHLRQIACFISEATTFQEAVRMAVGHGTTILLNNGYSAGGQPSVEDGPPPNNLWFPELEDEISDGKLSKRVMFTRAAIERVAMAAGDQVNVQETILRCVSVAVEVRAADS
jgi:hypothetical protein